MGVPRTTLIRILGVVLLGLVYVPYHLWKESTAFEGRMAYWTQEVHDASHYGPVFFSIFAALAIMLFLFWNLKPRQAAIVTEGNASTSTAPTYSRRVWAAFALVATLLHCIHVYVGRWVSSPDQSRYEWLRNTLGIPWVAVLYVAFITAFFLWTAAEIGERIHSKINPESSRFSLVVLWVIRAGLMGLWGWALSIVAYFAAGIRWI